MTRLADLRGMSVLLIAWRKRGDGVLSSNLSASCPLL